MGMEAARKSQSMLERALSRREAIKAGGIGVVGLVFGKPLIETIIPKPAFANYVTSTTTSSSTSSAQQLQGCGTGYWQDHLDAWPAPYWPNTHFSSVFSLSSEQTNSLGGNKTLLQVLTQGGDCEKALGREAVAALLNSVHPGVVYGKSEAQVISEVNAALASANCAAMDAMQDVLEQLNEAVCPL